MNMHIHMYWYWAPYHACYTGLLIVTNHVERQFWKSIQ